MLSSVGASNCHSHRMESVEANSGFSLDSHEMGHRLVYYSNNSQKLPIRNAPNYRLRNNEYLENGHNGENVDVKSEVLEDEEDHKDGIGENEEYGEDEVLGIKGDCEDKTQNNVIGPPDKHVDDDDDDDDDSYDDFDDNDEDDRKNDNGGITNDAERRTKKRKLKSLALSYEFAPRVPPPPPEMASPPRVTRLSAGGRKSQTVWTERESFVLLEAWGDRCLQYRKRSLRAEEWKEVAERVSDSETSRANRSERQCRNRLDTLKKKYQKEKSRLAEIGGSSKWVYFTKMDMLMSSSATEQTGLSCGLDSGEYVFANPRVYLNRSNGMDGIRDSPGNSESSQKEEEKNSDGLLPKKRKSGRESRGNFRLLACSFKKFRKIYEKMENPRTQQMIELEKMRMQFQQDLEADRQQIMESALAEIVRIRLGNGHNDTSFDNAVS